MLFAVRGNIHQSGERLEIRDRHDRSPSQSIAVLMNATPFPQNEKAGQKGINTFPTGLIALS
jgi:hypothetical protein